MKEYIEREALYSEIVPHYKSANAFGSSRNVCKTWGKVLDMVQNFPAADVVERKRGEWKYIGGDEWCCSCFGFVASTEGRWEPMTANFCEDCGADMRGENNG